MLLGRLQRPKAMSGLVTASQITSATSRSFLPVSTYGLTVLRIHEKHPMAQFANPCRPSRGRAGAGVHPIRQCQSLANYGST